MCPAGSSSSSGFDNPKRSGDLGPSRSASVRLREVDGVIFGALGTLVVGVSSLNPLADGSTEVSPERVGESRCLGSTGEADLAETPQKFRGGDLKASGELSPLETLKDQRFPRPKG